MDFTLDGRKAFAYTAAHALDPAKPTVAFVHGAGLDHSWWGLQSRWFGYHGRNAFALDLPGHGRSEGPPLAAVDAMADWVMRALSANGLGKAAIIGHSMGSLVALAAAAAAPERVERIALIGTAYPMTVGEAFLDAARRDDVAAFDMETIWGHAPQVPFAANPNPGMWLYGDSLARLRRLAPGVLHNDLRACHEYAGGMEAAARVRCPALFILGRRDVMTPPRAAAGLAKAVAGSRTVQVGPSGHSLMSEAPDDTLDALIDFLTGD